MFRISLKNIWSRKGRLLLTALAIIAGTAFLSGVFVFTDTMQSSFDKMFATAYSKTDAVVRSADVIEGANGAEEQRDKIPVSFIDKVKSVPGVAEVEGQIQGLAAITVGDKVIGTDGPPRFGTSWSDSASFPFQLAEGHAPTGPTEVVVDRGSAKSGPIKIGDKVKITTTVGVGEYTVVGIVTFAGSDSALGTTWSIFDFDTAQKVLTKTPGYVDFVAARADAGVSQTELTKRITATLDDPKIQVLTGAQATKEEQDSVAKVLNIITIAFSVFALISLFVGSFIIYNVFSISAAQRTRENALLRAVGASRGQVTRSMFGEAFAVAVVGSLLGCLGGLGLAAVILRIMKSVHWLSEDTSLSIQPQGFVITVVVGVLVTLVCAIAPAIRSGRVPPLAAMRDVAVDNSDMSRKRLVFGLVCIAGVVVATIFGLQGNTNALGIAAALLFTTIIVLGPLVAGPFARWVSPLMSKLRPVSGTIAARNAARNPKRTALTAGALAIVVSLFIGVATLGSSAKATAAQVLNANIASDYVVVSKTSNGSGGIPTSLADEINASGVGQALGVGVTVVKLDPDGEAGPKKASSEMVYVADGALAAQVMNLPFDTGSFAQLVGDSALVSRKTATDQNLKVGSTVVVTLPDGTTPTLTVVGIFNSTAFRGWMLPRSLFSGEANQLTDFAVYVKSVKASAEETMKAIVATYPTTKLQSMGQYVSSQADQVDQFLNLIYGLLGMSMFIAIAGIVITLLLAVYERRRELGLVRAVGMTRRQVRSSVTGESLLTALLGTVLGVVLGIALGWLIVQALKDEGLSVFRLPLATLVTAAVGAVILALIAAFLPARRAAKADILDAIATT